MIDRERYALIKSFTETLLEYKDEIRTLKERCEILEEELNRKECECTNYKSIVMRLKIFEGKYKEQLNRKEIE